MNPSLTMCIWLMMPAPVLSFAMTLSHPLFPQTTFFFSGSPIITHFTHDANSLTLLLATLTFNVSYLCSLFNTYRRHYTSYL
uniref:Uncharacterized protein n=1 Tax=Rhipicephalus appendiculatus TaxID=34631 RepID=A0A131YB78_RHIAP